MENSSRLRILYVLDSINYGSGVASVVMNYLRHINMDHFVFDVVVHKNSEPRLVREIESLGGNVYQLPDINLRGFLSYRRAFGALLNDKKYTFIHGHIANAAFLYMKEAKHKQVPHRIIHSHNAQGASSVLKRIRNKILQHNIPRWSNHFFACSDLAAEYLFGNRVDQRSVTIIPNAIDINRFRFNVSERILQRKALNIQEHTLCIGHIGRFDPQKNHTFLIRIFKEILNMHPDTCLVLAGGGTLETAIRQQADELGVIDHILFQGVVSNPAGLYQAFDVFLLPSLFEGWPVTGVEAQSMGLPCIFSDRITKTAKILDQTEFLPIDDPTLWAAETLRLAGESNREDRSEYVKEKGYDISEQAKTLEALYLSFLG